MITKQPELRHGLPLTINFEIPAYWIPEQALAVMMPPTPKSTINRSKPLNLKTKGSKRGPPSSQRCVAVSCMVLHRRQELAVSWPKT